MRRSAALMLVVSLVATACGNGSADAPRGTPTTLIAPDGPPRALVVLVPGGSWTSADPTGLVPLARRLAEAGHAAVTTTYRTAADEASFPLPVQDVLCAADTAARDLPAGTPVVLLGHSAGAHLALLAALRPELRGSCDAPPVPPAAVVGLAGAYDVHALAPVALQLFGVPEQADPDRWREGDPLVWADRQPALPVLLLHGDADTLVPAAVSEAMAAALRAGGHPVRLQLLPGADHLQAFSADVVGDVVVDWLEAVLAPGPS